MTKENRVTKIIFLILSIFIVYSCEKEDHTVEDIDGNVYHTVTIGSQIWMVENLKVTRYNDSTSITFAMGSDQWANMVSGAYCFSNYNTTVKETYGALYNWYGVNSGKLCPIGWHVPSEAEWTSLTNYLGGDSIAGSKLKEVATTHWYSMSSYPWEQNVDATNESGFTALPGGIRFPDGVGAYYGAKGLWWSSSEFDDDNAWSFIMNSYNSSVDRKYYYKQSGLSARCLMDNLSKDK